MSTLLAGRLTRAALAIASVFLFAHCADPFPSEGSVPADAAFAKGGGKGGGGSGGSTDVTVTAADPDYGQQGDADEEVTISGSGFSGDVQVAWERNGVPDPKIVVHSTAVINSSTIRARISIADDADLGLYDISVQLGPGGKRGVGTELFEVTTAQLIAPLCKKSSGGDPNVGRDASAEGLVVGGSCGQAFLWDGTTTRSFGTGFATGIDDKGLVIVGGTGHIAGGYDDAAVIWNLSGVVTALPVPVSGGKPWIGRANSVASDANGDAVFIAGRIGPAPSGKGKTRAGGEAAIWVRDGTQSTGWRLIHPLPTPPGAEGIQGVTDVSATGVGVGRFTPARVWEPDGVGGYNAYILGDGQGSAWGISPDAKVIVGIVNQRAAYWERLSGPDWTGPHPLHPPCASNEAGNARAERVNGDYVIVGWNCTRAVAWKVGPDGSVAAEIILPGLGRTETGAARGISRGSGLAGPRTARVAGGSDKVAVYWEVLY